MVLLGVLAAIPAYAQDTQFQQDPVERLTAEVLVTLIILGIAVIFYSLVRYRGRTEQTGSWALVLLGVGILPVVTGMVGTVLVFERAEHVDFCMSCHLTMKPYVDDLKNSQSTSLAALHYKNRYIPTDQCYQCHTSYGMHGTVEAKMAGMIDTFKYYTRTYKLPIKMRAPYKNDDCLKCHAASEKWLGIHGDFKEVVFNGDMKCMECHGMEHPAHTFERQQARNENN
jgi:nitrate/TMAO reductase-like tetraheme cytochrome c subunit